MARPAQDPLVAAAIWKRIRARYAGSLKELAKLSGLCYAMVLRCNDGTRCLGFRSFNKIAAALAVDPQELLGGETIKAPDTEAERRAKRIARGNENSQQVGKRLKRWREKHRAEYRRQENLSKKLTRSKANRQVWLKIIEYYQGKCLACGTTENVIRDHVLPLAQGGDNNPRNLQPLCMSCNTRKKGMATDYRPDQGAWCASLMEQQA